MANAKQKEEYLENQEMRDGESYRRWYRSDRVCQRDGGWFIQTREGIEVGPYECEFDASVEANALIEKLQQAAGDDSERIIRSHKSLAGTERDLTSTDYTDYAQELSPKEISEILETLASRNSTRTS